MNSYTKLLTVYTQFLLVTCLLCAVTLGVNAQNTQEWKEAWIVNTGGYFSSNFVVAYDDHTVLMWPDPDLGELTIEFESSKLYVNFEPYPDAVGIAEYVV